MLYIILYITYIYIYVIYIYIYICIYLLYMANFRSPFNDAKISRAP